jgi:hypothetical protein
MPQQQENTLFVKVPARFELSTLTSESRVPTNYTMGPHRPQGYMWSYHCLTQLPWVKWLGISTASALTALDLYCKGAQFESRQGHKLS